MTFEVKSSVGMPDRLLNPGDFVADEELGEGVERLVCLGAIEPVEEPKPRRQK